jgi:hypothetical protein
VQSGTIKPNDIGVIDAINNIFLQGPDKLAARRPKITYFILIWLNLPTAPIGQVVEMNDIIEVYSCIIEKTLYLCPATRVYMELNT